MNKCIYKLISLILVITVLFSVASCNARGIKTFQNDVSAQELIRVLVSAINDKNSVPESFSSIPENQRKDLSYSYFSEYLSIIRDLSNERGRIVSFRLLSEDEEQAYFESCSSDGIVMAELLFDEEYDSPVYIFISEDDSGKAYLSLDWIKGFVSIQRYSDYYFTMLEEGNIDGLFSLLRPGLDLDDYSDTAVYARANALVDYYETMVRSVKSQFVESLILPEHLRITIPEAFNDNTNTLSNHVVDIVLDGNSSYTITDEIPFIPDASLTSLYSDFDEVIRCGNHYSNFDLYELLGNPINISVHQLTDDELATEETNYNQKLLVNYRGVVLLFKANYNADDEWEGELNSIRFSGESSFSAGDILSIGMTRGEVLESFPYIEQTNYDFDIVGRDAAYNISIRFDEDVVSSIRIVKN